MAKILKNTTSKNVHLHIEKAYKTIDDWLPRNYVDEVKAKLPKNKIVSKGTMHNVRQKKSTRLDVLNAMVEVALDHKKEIEKLKKLTA
jgi:hypothetical protein